MHKFALNFAKIPRYEVLQVAVVKWVVRWLIRRKARVRAPG